MADPFEEADTANAAGARRAALERVKAQRAAKRDNQPLPEGGLFDEVRRNTQELF